MVAARSFWVLLLILEGVVTTAVVLPWCRAQTRRYLIQRWSQRLLRRLDIQLKQVGNWPDNGDKPIVVTSNHISWVDIFVIQAIHPVRFVSKSEVRKWPVFGWLAARIGTLFLVRSSRRQTAAVNQQMQQALADGDDLGLFPEATTTDGSFLLPFKSSLLQSPIDARVGILTLGLRYLQADGSPNTHIPYVGDMSFTTSLAQVLRQPPSQAIVSVGTLRSAESLGHRRELAHTLEQATANLLNLEVRPQTPEKSPHPPA